MTDLDPPPNPETPWEFLDDDDLREEPGPGAEDLAMHVEDPGLRVPPSIEHEEDEVVVHYLDDEHPEAVDRSKPTTRPERTANVDELLVRQHYLGRNEP